MSDLTGLRAGWAMHFRAHGLVSESPFSVEFRLKIDGRDVDLIFEIARQPSVPPVRLGIPQYALGDSAGNDLNVQKPTLEQSDHEGSWITVLASSVISIPTHSAIAFLANPYQQLESLEAVVSDAATKELRRLADTAASAITSTVMPSRPELWSETQIYWYSDTHFVARGLTDPAEILSRFSIPDTYQEVLTRRVSGIFSAPERIQRILRLAHHWLLAAHRQAHGSNERFAACYQSIEALCSVIDQVDTSRDTVLLDRIDSLICEGNEGSKAELLTYTQQLRERIAKPPLKSRFRALAERFSRSTAENDVTLFGVVTRARNDLVHGRTSRVSAVMDGTDVQVVCYELGSRYIGLILEMYEQTGRPVVFRDS